MRRLRQQVAKNPLAWLALWAGAGVVLADHAAARPWWWCAAAAASAAVTLLRPRAWLLALTAMLSFGFVQQVCLSEARDHPLRHLLNPGERVSATLVGQFIRAPMIRSEGPAKHEARVLIREVDIPALNRRVVGETRIRIWLTDPDFVPEGGDYEIQGDLGLIQRPWNPGGFDAERASLLQGVSAECTALHIKRVGEPRFSLKLALLKLAEKSRNWISGQLAYGIEDQEMSRTLITTMALGTAEAGSADLQEPFRNSGTLHVFAVSGLHVTLMALIGVWLLKWAGVRRMKAVILLLPLVFIYAFITGWVPSAARSAFMSAVLMLAPLSNRQSRLINSLGLAALVLFSADTLQFFQIGFQLSFGVLAAIALGAGLLAKPFAHLAELDPFMPPMLASRWDNLGVWGRRKVLRGLSTSMVAWIGSLPLTIAYFGSCTPVAIVANLFLVPLSELSLGAAVGSILAAGVHCSLVQSWFNQINAVLAACMLFCAQSFSSIPGSHFSVALPSLDPPPSMTMQVLSMPIGEGAQMLSSGDEHWWLDCGSAKYSRRTTIPFLRYSGISSMQGMILSHADSEHISAAPELVERGSISQVFIGPNEPWRLDSHATSMWQVVAAAGDRIKHLKADDVLTIGDSRLRVLYPREDDRRDKADDRAMVIRVDGGAMRILWCNDAGFETEKALLERWSPADLRADVLVRNQHKADWSALPEFLAAVRPQAVVTSNAPGIVEERLPEHLKHWCTANGCSLWDLNETGMVQIKAWSDRIELSAWLSGEKATLRAR